jgi:PAS domain S-box-containing protein
MSAPPNPPSAPQVAESEQVAALRAEVAELFGKLEALQALQASLHASEERFRALISSLQVGVVVQGPKAEILLCNAVSLDLLGLSEAEYLGRTSFDPRWRIVDENGQDFAADKRPVARVLATRSDVRNVVMAIFRPRRDDWVSLLVNAVPQLDEGGEVRQVVSTFTDITALRSAEARARALSDELLAVSTPCIPIADGVMVLPLIGRLDRLRSQHALASLLSDVTARRARTVLLDLTGLVDADENFTQLLSQMVSAVRLLGAQIVLSGIRAGLAQELVTGGQPLADVPTFATLQQGVRTILAARRS